MFVYVCLDARDRADTGRMYEANCCNYIKNG